MSENEENAVYLAGQRHSIPSMSATAEAILEQLKQLPPADQQEIIRQLLRSGPHTPPSQQKAFPTVKVRGGIITSVQVAEALDDD